MMFDDEDKRIARVNSLDAPTAQAMMRAVNCNDSDVDFCDFNGRTVILYSWGNQRGTEFLARAEYDGTWQERLESYFE